MQAPGLFLHQLCLMHLQVCLLQERRIRHSSNIQLKLIECLELEVEVCSLAR
jgi:hypothetical protein